MTRSAALLALLAVFLLTSSARAVFQKSQMDRVDTEALFDAEYFLDLLAFSTPMEWDYEWSASTTGYRINSASLDCCDLYLDQEMKFQRRLTSSGLEFIWRYIQYEDKDRQDLRHLIELRHPIPGGFTFQLFGEPAFLKEDADLGVGLAFAPVPGLTLTARRTFVDFNFNKRGSTTETYLKKPLTDEFLIRVRAGAHRLGARLEIDHPLRRRDPSAARVYHYRRTTASVEWEMGSPRDLLARAAYRYEFLREGDFFNPDVNLASIDHTRQVHRLEISVLSRLTDRDSLEAGQHLLVRSAQSDTATHPSNGVFHGRWELMPYARWRRRAREWLVTEISAFLSKGEIRRRFPQNITRSTYNDITEAKIGTSVEFVFSDNGRITLNGSWDLDSLTTQLWDGGNIRAMFRF